MGCLFAEFKLTAMLYGGEEGGYHCSWVAPLYTPPFLIHGPKAFSLSLSESHRRNLERCCAPGVLSGGQLTHGGFHWKKMLGRVKTFLFSWKRKTKQKSES